MNNIIIRLVQLPIKFYMLCVSPWLGPRCRFYPTCSSYALEALEKHGIAKGFYLSVKRVLCCHPFSHAHWYDPVPGHKCGHNKGKVV